MGRHEMKMHKSITFDRVYDAVMRQMTSLDNPSFCIACGDDTESVKPDARRYKCEHCGRKAVFGAEVLLLTMVT
jgi:hypothetical protein